MVSSSHHSTNSVITVIENLNKPLPFFPLYLTEKLTTRSQSTPLKSIYMIHMDSAKFFEQSQISIWFTVSTKPRSLIVPLVAMSPM